jgi:hypothetical protein
MINSERDYLEKENLSALFSRKFKRPVGVILEIFYLMSIKAWKDVNWSLTSKRVSRLQQRIYRAKRNEIYPKLHRLQRRLLKSLDAKLLAVRYITEKNTSPRFAGQGLREAWGGRQTPGVDNVIILSNVEKLKLAKSLSLNSDKSIRRV